LTVTLRHALTGRVPEPFVPAEKHEDIVREARALWAIYAVIAAGSVALHTDAALIWWILPAIAGQPFRSRKPTALSVIRFRSPAAGMAKSAYPSSAACGSASETRQLSIVVYTC
jgi:hypothetical protein